MKKILTLLGFGPKENLVKQYELTKYGYKDLSIKRKHRKY